MSEENVKIVLSAEDQATAAIKKLKNELQSLKKMVDSFKSGFTKGLSGLDTGSKVQSDLNQGPGTPPCAAYASGGPLRPP